MIDPLEIQALVDGELSPAEEQALRARLAECNRSTNEYLSMVMLKQTVQGKCQTYNCEVTWSKCVKRLDELDRTKRVEHVVGKYAWGICGAFATLIVVGGYFSRGPQGAVIQSSEVPKVSAGMISVPGIKKTAAAVRDFVSSTLGRKAPEVETGGLQVTDLAKGTINGMPAVKIRLHDSIGDADLVVVPGAQDVSGVRQLESGEYSIAQVNGQSLVTWSRGGYAMMIVSPRPVADLVSLASKLRVQR